MNSNENQLICKHDGKACLHGRFKAKHMRRMHAGCGSMPPFQSKSRWYIAHSGCCFYNTPAVTAIFTWSSAPSVGTIDTKFQLPSKRATLRFPVQTDSSITLLYHCAVVQLCFLQSHVIQDRPRHTFFLTTWSSAGVGFLMADACT